MEGGPLASLLPRPARRHGGATASTYIHVRDMDPMSSMDVHQLVYPCVHKVVYVPIVPPTYLLDSHAPSTAPPCLPFPKHSHSRAALKLCHHAIRRLAALRVPTMHCHPTSWRLTLRCCQRTSALPTCCPCFPGTKCARKQTSLFASSSPALGRGGSPVASTLRRKREKKKGGRGCTAPLRPPYMYFVAICRHWESPRLIRRPLAGFRSQLYVFVTAEAAAIVLRSPDAGGRTSGSVLFMKVDMV